MAYQMCSECGEFVDEDEVYQSEDGEYLCFECYNDYLEDLRMDLLANGGFNYAD